MVIARYVNRELASMLAMVLLLLLVVTVGGRFIGYLQQAAVGKYAADSVISIISLRIPEFLQLLLPFALYVSLLLSVSRLYADQEMAVLFASGASPQRIVGWFLLPIVLIAALVAWCGFVITPMAQTRLQVVLEQAKVDQGLDGVSPGVFHTYDAGRRVTYSEDISDEDELNRVFMSERRSDRSTVTIWARSGRHYEDPDTGSQFLHLENGRRYEGRVGESDYRVVEFGALSQRLGAGSKSQGRTLLENLATERLLRLPGAAARAELHWRLAMPLLCVIGGLLAIGFARVPPSRGRFSRVGPGLLAFVAYLLLLMVVRSMAGDGYVPAAPSFVILHLIMAGVAVWYLRGMARPN